MNQYFFQRREKDLDISLRAYNPHQPRIPIGQLGAGRWMALWSSAGRASQDAFRRVTEVIWICVVGSASRSRIDGVPRFRVEYDCPDGSSVVREGVGHKFPGFIRFRS